jgi:alpha-glucosidase
MTIFKDGINANRNASDYVRTEGTVPADGIVKVHMAKGGGWAARIEI